MSKTITKPLWALKAENRMSVLGFKQSDLLDTFEVTTPGAIGHYLSGRREPNIYSIVKLAEKLEMPLLDLLNVNDTPKLNSTDKDSSKYLTDAFRLLSRIVGLTDNEIKVFFNTYEKMGAENIVKAANELCRAGDDSDAKVDAIIQIQDFMKRAN